MNQIKIGNFIAECRKSKGLTQQELADKLGLTAKAISKWECGKGLPDVSLYEDICAELGISLNEFFAGEHIEENHLMKRADENLESILKDYYKMKHQKNIFLTTLIVILSAIIVAIAFVILYILKQFAFLGLLLGLDSLKDVDIRNDISQYDKAYYIETYNGDLDSNLSVFPDTIGNQMTVLQFESSMSTGLFDTDGYIILEYTLDDTSFADEINRLKSLELTITNYNNESYTNYVKYQEGTYLYPAYITIDGFGNTYEYALIDEENNRIICVYLAYLDSSGFEYTEYLKLDRTDYDSDDTLKKYSMYNHTFDGGNSYVEFDD